ncbi:hypothetical protein D9757_014133 [Collybiopsis confluens]|uniref:Uncharacterized protein n=1 Tax=Collybiopsis confluens TaxID=2823264 RepID=A0A8H5CX48_9AGAR|nr:hypothetical protein D9757_014133 [Collybiopsis confluens]
MNNDFPLSTVRFVGLWIETLFYGMYSVLFGHCIYILRHNTLSAKVNRPLFVSAIVMFVLATGLIITDFARGYAAFIFHGGTLEGPTDYFEQFWIWSNLLREFLYVAILYYPLLKQLPQENTNNVIQDSRQMLSWWIYRLFVVWGFKKYVVVGPIILLIAEVVFASLSVWGESISDPGATIQSFNIYTWAMVSFSISCVTNIVVTALIAARIWWYSHRASRFLGEPHKQKYYQAIIIIIESGSISGLTMFLILIFYRTTLTSADFIYFPACQVLGIVPTLIIVRVGLGVSMQDSTQSSTVTSLRFPNNSRSGNSNYHQGTDSQPNATDATITMTTHKVGRNYNSDTLSEDGIEIGHSSRSRDKSFATSAGRYDPV